MILGADRLILLLPIVLLPVTNVFVRYRLAYYPKRTGAGDSTVGDDVSGGTADEQVERLPGLIGVMRTIYREEGWGAFYNGLLPVLILTILTAPHLSQPTPNKALHWLIFKPIITPAPIVDVLAEEKIALFPLFVKNTLTTFALTWIYRCISTPSQLSVSRTSLLTALQTLFSPYELSSTLFFPLQPLSTPGLAYAMSVSLLIRTFYIGVATKLDWKDPNNRDGILFVTLPTCLVALLALPPLDFITTRLLTQKNLRYLPFWKGIGAEAMVYMFIAGIINILGIPIAADPSPKNYIGPVVEFVVCVVDVIFGLFLSVAWTRRWDRLSGDGEERQALPTEESPLLTRESGHPGERGQMTIRIRSDTQQYISFWDCLRTIVKEEGFFTLYRCWWLTIFELAMLTVVV